MTIDQLMEYLDDLEQRGKEGLHELDISIIRNTIIEWIGQNEQKVLADYIEQQLQEIVLLRDQKRVLTIMFEEHKKEIAQILNVDLRTIYNVRTPDDFSPTERTLIYAAGKRLLDS